MTTLIILLSAVVLFFSYTIWAIIKIGFIPNSWSDTYYELGKNGRTWQVFMVLMGFLFFGLTLELLDGYWFQFLGFFTSASIAFVGVAARFRRGTDMQALVHYLAAYTAAGASLLLVILSAIFINWGVFTFPVFSSFICLSAYIVTRDPETKVFWAEYACFSWTFLLLIYLAIEKL